MEVVVERKYQAPALDESIAEELERYIARRKDEISKGQQDAILSDLGA